MKRVECAVEARSAELAFLERQGRRSDGGCVPRIRFPGTAPAVVYARNLGVSTTR